MKELRRSDAALEEAEAATGKVAGSGIVGARTIGATVIGAQAFKRLTRTKGGDDKNSEGSGMKARYVSLGKAG